MNNYVKIIATLVLGFVLAIGFSFILEKGQVRFHVHKYSRMRELFVNSTPYDIIFIGSSRTHATIDPAIIDSITGLNTYNAGTEGGVLTEFKLTLDGYLEKHPSPRMVLLSLDANSFKSGKTMFFPFQYFWVLKNQQVATAIKENKAYKYVYVKYLKFVRQIYYDDYTKGLALRGLLNQNELTYSGFSERKGYVTNGINCTDTTLRYQDHEISIDENAIAQLQAIIDTCKKRNIRLDLSYAPEYDFRLQASIKNFSEFTTQVDIIAKKQNLLFFRDDSLTMCKNPCFFANYGHVNIYGATEYSKILGKRIRGLLLKE